MTAVVKGVELLTWPDSAGSVLLYRIADDGHSWPGGNNDPAAIAAMDTLPASELMLEFLLKHPLPVSWRADRLKGIHAPTVAPAEKYADVCSEILALPPPEGSPADGAPPSG